VETVDRRDDRMMENAAVFCCLPKYMGLTTKVWEPIASATLGDYRVTDYTFDHYEEKHKWLRGDGSFKLGPAWVYSRSTK
jgi:hypothetical protein